MDILVGWDCMGLWNLTTSEPIDAQIDYCS